MYLPRSAGFIFDHTLAVGVLGGEHRGVDVGFVRLGDLGEGLLGRRIHRREVALRARRDELATDEQVVARLEPHVIGRLRRRGVVPGRAELEHRALGGELGG
jgi:hypothetical protein